MARYSDTLRDQESRPVAGALVTVLDYASNLAVLTNDDASPLTNPFYSGADGSVVFNAADGFYNFEYRYGGRLVQTDNRIVVGAPEVDPALDALSLSTGAAFVGAAGTSWTTVQGYIDKIQSADGGKSVGTTPAIGSASRTLHNVITERAPITPKDYSAVGGGANDATPFQNALSATFDERRTFHINPQASGDAWRIDTSLQVRVDDYLSYISAFGTAPRILGEGFGRSVIDFRGTGAAIDIDSDAAHTLGSQGFFYGLEIGHLTIRRSAGAGTAHGIKLRSAYQAYLHDLHIIGMSGDGIQMICSTGDYDACNMPALERVRIDTCAGWGVVIGETGHNETSFVKMGQVFVQGCGTDMGSISSAPTSGGMRWAGQILRMEQCAFTLNRNVPLYIPGQSGGAQTFFVEGTAFENNYRRAGPLIRGLSGGGGTFQLYSNDSYVATVGLEIDGSTHTVRNLDFRRVVVRATSGNNPYTAFKLSGASAMPETIRVRDVIWDNFDYAGQIRFDGFRFDLVSSGCSLTLASTTSLVLKPDGSGRGNYLPLRLRGAGAVPAAAGEWVASDLPSVGIGITNAGLAASTRYYCYFYDNANSKALELSTTAPTQDAVSGYLVKTGDATKLYVGSVETDAGSLFKLTAGGWLDPIRVPSTQVGVPAYLWRDATGALRTKATAPTSDTDGTLV